MQTITKAEVIAAARDYYEKGLLTAQQEDVSKRQCNYKINGYRCSVGACLSEETLENILKDGMNAKSVSLFWGRFLVADGDTKVFVEDLQFYHDNWCRGNYGGIDKQKFCEMIDVEPKT